MRPLFRRDARTDCTNVNGPPAGLIGITDVARRAAVTLDTRI